MVHTSYVLKIIDNSELVDFIKHILFSVILVKQKLEHLFKTLAVK